MATEALKTDARTPAQPRSATAAKPAAVAKPAAAAKAAAAGKKKSRLPLIAGLVVLLAAGGAGAWFALQPEAAAAGAAGAATTRAAPKATPIYYRFDPAFVVNFGENGSARYLQVTVEAMSRDAGVINAIKTNEPAIRNDLVMLYSAQRYDTLSTVPGKEQLRAETLAAIRKVLGAEGTDVKAIEGVYFTGFVIQ